MARSVASTIFSPPPGKRQQRLEEEEKKEQHCQDKKTERYLMEELQSFVFHLFIKEKEEGGKDGRRRREKSESEWLVRAR
jgi:hypothetical protein